MTPEQQKLLEAIYALPTHDSRLSVQQILGPEIKEMEQEAERAAKDMAARGELAQWLDSPSGENAMSPRQILQEIKRYQMLDDGTLLSKSRARTGIPGVPDHQEQRKAFEAAADFSRQDAAIDRFVKNLHKNPKAKSLFDEKTLRLFDVGYGNGETSKNLVNSLQDVGIAPKNIVFGGMDLVSANADRATQKLKEAGLPDWNIRLQGGALGFDDRKLFDGTPNHATDLESGEGDTYRIATALNVYNFGNREKFLRQINKVLGDESIAIF